MLAGKMEQEVKKFSQYVIDTAVNTEGGRLYTEKEGLKRYRKNFRNNLLGGKFIQ